MLDLSKIEITEVDCRTLRGVLKFTVEIKAPTGEPFLEMAKSHLLFRFFTKFYGEISDEVDRLFDLALNKCKDQHERDELMMQWKTLWGLSHFHTTNDRDFFQPKMDEK